MIPPPFSLILMYQDYFYEQRENLDYRDRQLPSPLKTIGAGAFSLLAFVVIRGAAVRGSSAASKALSRNLARVVRSVQAPAWAKSYRNLRAAAIRSGRAEAREFGVLAPKDIGIAATVKEIPLIHRARAKFTTTFAKQIESRRQYYYRDLGLRQKELYAALKHGHHPKSLDQRLKALKTFMKPDGAFSARFMAAAGKWGERYAKMIPGFYVADQALGLFSKARPEHLKPAWYNIPGHVAGMVRFGIEFAPIDLAFSGALRVLRYGRAVAARSAQLGVREFPHVREGFTKAVETLHIKGAQWHASISKHWATRRRGAWPSIQELKRGIRDRKAPHSMDIIRLYSDIVKDAKVQRKPYFKMEQQLTQILGVLGMRKDPTLLREMSRNTEIKKAFDEVLAKFERRPKQTFIEYALKTPERPADWAPRRLSTTSYIKRYAKEAQWDPETTNNALKLLGGKELYYGQNILRKGNFSMFNASFAAGKVIDVMGKWKVPFISWHPFRRMMVAGIPRIGIPGKGPAFRILDEKQSALMAEAAANADLNVTRSPQLKVGEYFMRIGDHLFRLSPEKLIERVSGHWRVSVDTITAGERRHFQGLVESQTDYEHTGWLGHLRQKFELGRSPHFIGKRLKEYIIQDFNPESPHVLMHEKGKYVNMLRHLQGDKILSPREQKEFINYSRAVGRHLYGSEQTALEVFHNNQGLRGKVLDILGGVDAKKAKKILNDANIDRVIDDLSLFDYALPETYSQRTIQQVRRALHDVQNLTGPDREFLLRSRSSILEQSSNLTVEDYLMGQYFKKTLENYSQAGKITEGVYDKIFKSIDDTLLAKREKSKAKSLFTSMKINRPMSDYLNVYSDQEVINSLDTVGHLRDIITPNESLLREVFKLDYKSLRESMKINRFMKDTLVPLEIQGFLGPIDEIWRVQGHGAPAAPKDLFGAAPGFGDMLKSDFKKFFRISDSATQINYEPYVTKQSMLLHRWAIRPFNMTLGWIGLDLHYRSNAEFMKKFLWKRALAIPAAIYGYRALDTFLTVNPLLDHTMFDDGLTSAGAQAIGKANLARAEVFDTLGITDFAQHMEGLMPGSMESPAAKLFRGAVLPLLGRRFGGGPGLMIGLGAAAATGFGLPDLTRSADELRDVYSGRKLLPVRSGRFWETSKLSYFGGRISSFQPSWYTKIVSQYKYTDAALGTKLESLLYTGPLGAITDSYHYERVRYHDRPYPTTAPLFSDIPIIGSVADMTIGRLLKPQTMMHEDELAAAQMGFDVETKNRILPGYNKNTMPPLHEARPGYFAPRHTVPSVSMKGMLGESFYRLTEAAGLRGFMTQAILGREGIGQYAPIYDDASAITSFGRQFWDLQAGGGLASEAWRRLYPRERFKNLVNPIRNLAPTWLPEDFKFGDPYTKIKGGLILLPSRAHEKLYKVRHNFPVDLEYFGYEPGEAAGRMLKLIRPEREEEYHYSFIKELVQKQLLMNRQLLSKDVFQFDPWNKLEGTVDAIIMNQSGNPELMQIKATTSEKLGFMQQPKPAHVAQLNFAMRQMKRRHGQILYVASDNPELTKSFYVEYSSERFHNDMARMNEARELASDMLLKGIGQVGESYSYPDRLQVLANSAPWSPEYKKVLKQCKMLDKFGLLDEEDRVKVNESRRQHDAIMRKFDFYPHRFSHGKWLTPDPIYNLMSQNVNIKAAAEYNVVERLMGAAYERLLEFDIPVVHSKLLPYYTSEQMYERQIGGSFSGNWSRPIHDYIRPWWHSFLLSSGPAEAAAKLGFAGALFAGPPGAAIGVSAGLLYGGGRAVAGRGTWVPGEVKRIREIDEYFDALEYIKNNQLYEQTGDPEYLKRSRETIYGITPMSTPAEFYRAVPYMERPFFWSFASIQDKAQQNRIKQRVSPTMRTLLEHYWSGDKKFTNPMIEDYNPKFRMPAEDWMGWREDIPLEDIQLKTVKNEGLDNFDFGLGWKPQELRMHNSPYAIKPIDISSPSGVPYGQEDLDAGDIKNFIRNVLQRYGVMNSNVTVTKSQGKGAHISLNIT